MSASMIGYCRKYIFTGRNGLTVVEVVPMMRNETLLEWQCADP